ncbi:hypothetical protein RIF23_12330 [Lipingzhangella sp. LS1_29]|uniref:DUF4351 domain-containing protein n=1 Tax=Lipingzhangella rawalii TaxID=2055835 RepID=A0ABU2H903_9ACTN|nr:hypothetical protein [Lipingzhangella rawalii]MDS1271084.1 hypothetical protein [Lipingzhangella rawalii]
MPSFEHEVLVQLFRDQPRLAVRLLRDVCGIEVPDSEAHVASDSAEFTDCEPTEHRSDAAVIVLGANERLPQLGVVVEIQRSARQHKFRSWATYAATFAERRACPVAVLVLCPNQQTADYYDRNYKLGPTFVLRPLVVGPNRVPALTDARQVAECPELGVLSVLAHGGAQTAVDILCAGLDKIDSDRARRYTGYVLALLHESERAYMEALMAAGTFEYMSEFTESYVEKGRAQGRTEGRTEGRAEGEARALIAVLEARGLEPSSEQRERIMSCRDLDQLELWIRRAATVDNVTELFD